MVFDTQWLKSRSVIYVCNSHVRSISFSQVIAEGGFLDKGETRHGQDESIKRNSKEQ